MPLEEIQLAVEKTAPPADVARLIQEADSRIDLFFERHKEKPLRAFIPSNYLTTYQALAAVQAGGLAGPGLNFCEWGCGFGVVAGLAAMLGFRSCGVEREPSLAREASDLMEAFSLPVDIVEADFVPLGFDFYMDCVGQTKQLIQSPVRYADTSWEHRLGLGMEDLDVVFVYPWPGEAQFISDLFEASASEGTLFLLYQGENDLTVYRKTSDALDDFLDEKDPGDLLFLDDGT